MILNTKLQEAAEVIVYYEIAIRIITRRNRSKLKTRNVKIEKTENNVWQSTRTQPN